MEMDKHQLYAKVYGQGIDYKTILEKYRKQIVFCTTFAYIYKCKYCIMYLFIYFFLQLFDCL